MRKNQKYFNKRKIFNFIFIILLVLVLGNISIANVNAKEIRINSVEKSNLINNTITSYSSEANSNTLNIDSVGIANFTEVKYISNADYFKANPYHAINDLSDNLAGTCTTVAMQMLMGYHNYYTDRRLIPEFGGNGLRYLNENYGDLNEHPRIYPSKTSGYGRPSIGTEVGLYEELMDYNNYSGVYLLGQAIGLVKDSALLFVNDYSRGIQDDVTITSGIINMETAKSDIDSGNPIILGCQPIANDSDDFHVVVAYGYAKYNNVDGFIVHCGWDSDYVHMWYPASWFAFQIRMSINHTHNIVNHGNNVNNLYREVFCTICGFTGVDCLYKVDSTGTKIIGTSYELSSNITIPSRINGNNIVSIGNGAFKDCIYLQNVSLPSTIKTIESNAFENCSNLTNITLNDYIESIGDAAFKGCTSLASISIPKSVTSIGNNAFINCTSLSSVVIKRENSEITTLGYNAFHYCSSSLQIKVPINRLAEYKNKDNWENYKNKIISENMDFDEIAINCLVDNFENITLGKGRNKLLKINVECSKTYKFSTNKDAKMVIYDADFTSQYSGDNTLYAYLNPGTYYLDVRHSSNETSGSISINYCLRWENTGEEIFYNQSSNLLTHLHEDNELFLNKLCYYNNRGAGFYKFRLSAFDMNENPIAFGEDSLILYNSSNRIESQILDKCPNSSQIASLEHGQNIIYVYLPRNGYFYIDVVLPSNDYEVLNLSISSVESQNLNLFDLNEDENSTVSIIDSSNKYDYVKKINIEQSGKFTISYNYSGNLTSSFEVLLLKQNYNSSTGQYSFENVILELMNSSNSSFTYTGNLESGNYYIGYLNKNDYNKIVIDLERHVTLSGEEILVTDPNYQTLCGSQISIIEMNSDDKSYRGTEITKNFTRIIYPNYNYDISPSRLDYYWYSSNENVAEVTEYGTVLGKTVGIVKIMAVLKSDPSKVFVKTFDIVDDTGTETIVVRSIIEVKLSEIENGEFQLPLEEANCPFPMFQYYNWTLDKTCDGNYSTNYDQWGVFTANGTGCFTLIGIYQKNTRITVIIHVMIVSG